MDWYDALYDYGTTVRILSPFSHLLLPPPPPLLPPHRQRPPSAAPIPQSLKDKEDRDLDIIPTLVAAVLFPKMKVDVAFLVSSLSDRN